MPEGPLEPEVDGTPPHEGDDGDNDNNAGAGVDAAAAGANGSERQVVRAPVEGKNAPVQYKEIRIPDNERSTSPYLTKYEKARVLGSRATQIA